MIVSCPCVKIYKDSTAFKRDQELFEAEFLKRQNLLIQEILRSSFTLGFGLDIKAIQ